MTMKLRNLYVGGPTSALLLLLKTRALYGFAVASTHSLSASSSSSSSMPFLGTSICTTRRSFLHYHSSSLRGGSIAPLPHPSHSSLKASTAEDVSLDNNTSNTDDDDDDDDDHEHHQQQHQQEDEEVRKAALEARTISDLTISNFGNIPYLHTTTTNNNDDNRESIHKVLFVLGGPGAGKGTQSTEIVSTYKCIHLSVGELLRNERKRDGSEHGRLIEDCLVKGKIVPVEISLALLRHAMDDASGDGGGGGDVEHGRPIFLVDGFPRNYDNLSGWTRNMSPSQHSVMGALVYDCPLEVLERRILGRAKTSGRSDDNLESAKKRFETFRGQTMPVVKALELVEEMQKEEEDSGDGDGDEKIGRLHVEHIMGDGTIEEVWDLTKKAMDKFVSNDVLTANTMLLEAIQNRDVDAYVALCSEGMLFSGVETDKKEGDASPSSADEIFRKYEIVSNFQPETDGDEQLVYSVRNAEIDVHNGTEATVSYDRRIETLKGELLAQYRETRVWSHQKKGWVNIHFSRKQLVDP